MRPNALNRHHFASHTSSAPKRRRRPNPAVAALFCLGLLGSTEVAFAQSLSDKAVEAEIEFARGLARDWAFVDIAQGVLDDVAKADLSERMNEELSLVRCEVFTNGARATFDPIKRNELLEKAIEAYDLYISENKYAANRPAAEGQLIDLSLTYAKSIDISLKDAVGEEATALREQKTSALEGAIARVETLVEEIENLPEDEANAETNNRRLGLLLKLGDINARLSESLEDDVVFGESAKEVLEELIFEAGEGSEIALRAQMIMGDVYLGEGEVETAREFYKGTIESVIPTDEDFRNDPAGLDWKNVPFEMKQKRFQYVELGLPGVQRTSRTLGEPEAGIEYALFFNNLYRNEGFQLSSLGHEAVLEMAMTFLEAGGYIGGNPAQGTAQWYATEEDLKTAGVTKRNRRTAVQFALDLAQQVADEAKGSQAGKDAGILLDKINERPEVELPISAILQAAEAKAKEGDQDEAIVNFYLALNRMDELPQAERAEFGAAAYYGLGTALRATDRDLEAAMAFREAILSYRDPNWDTKNAKRYNYTMRAFAKESGGAANETINALVTESENFVIEFPDPDGGGSVDQIIFSQAEKLLKSEKFEQAIKKYQEITPSQGMYEPATVRIGQTMLQLRQVREALAHLDSYLNEYIPNPTNDPTTPSGEDRRRQSQGKAIYNAGLIEQILANSAFKKSEGTDTSGFEAVVTRLKDFQAEYGGLGSIALKCQEMLSNAHAQLGQTAEADAIVQAMIESDPESRETASAALKLYQAYKDRREALTSSETPDAEAISAATLDMAKALSVSNGITPGVSYGYLRNESLLWLEIDRWAEARGSLEKIVKRFLGDEEQGETVIKQVVPDLAEAMIETGAVGEAKDLLSPYMLGEDAKLKTRTPTILMSRAMVGSIVGEGTAVQATPGAGGTEEEFDFITSRLNTIEDSIPSWTAEWYEAKLAAIYAYYIWGQDNVKKLESAKSQLNDMMSQMDNDPTFKLVDEACNAEEVDPALRRRLGNGILAARYRWLFAKTR